MFLTTHAAAGLLISRHVDDPLAIFGLAFASHFLLDFIPHGDEELYHDEEWLVQRRFRRAVIVNAFDVAGLALIIVWAAYHPGEIASRNMLIGILGGILPDFLSFLFPVIHERLSWLFLVRWLYKLTKPTGLRYLIRGQNWIHNLLHHEIIRRDIPFQYGLAIQVLIVGACLVLSR